MRQQAISRLDDATAIYCDEGCDLARCPGETLPHAVVSLRRPEGCKFFAHPSRQILMFDSEWDSLDFYHDHRAELEGHEVFVRLTNADAFLLRRMDRVIVAQTDASQIVQGLLYTCPGVQIDFYNPDDTDFSQFYKTDALTSFGMTSQLFNDRSSNDAIVYYLAKRISYQVARPDAASPRDDRGGDRAVGQPGNQSCDQFDERFEARVNEYWHSLDSFTRASYLNFVKYHTLRRRLAAKLAEQDLSFAEEEMGETEHVRWARFYTLNHWECGATTRSEAEDFNRRIYACLAPYSQISAEDRERELARAKALAEKTAHEMLVPDRRRNRHRGIRAPWSRG